MEAVYFALQDNFSFLSVDKTIKILMKTMPIAPPKMVLNTDSDHQLLVTDSNEAVLFSSVHLSLIKADFTYVDEILNFDHSNCLAPD